MHLVQSVIANIQLANVIEANRVESVLLPVIEKALHGLRYGYVQLVVHDGQLVSIERVEKIRVPSEIPK